MRMKDWNDEPESGSVYIPDTVQSYVNKLKLEMDSNVLENKSKSKPILDLEMNPVLVDKNEPVVVEKIVEKSIPCKVILQNLNKKCDSNCSLLFFPCFNQLESILFYGVFGNCTLSLKHNEDVLSSTTVEQSDKPQFVFLKNLKVPNELVALELIYESNEQSESNIVFVEITF